MLVGYPSHESESEAGHKACTPRLFLDEDGEDVDTYAEFIDLFPTV